MFKYNFKKSFITKIIVLFVLFFPFFAHAMEIQPLPNLPVAGDYIVGPGKFELLLAPGESATRDLNITNRTGKILNVKIEIEDFTGDDTYTTRLLGNEKGPYSLKDYIVPEVTSFKLAHGERAVLPIKINIPLNAEPGGLYGSVIVKVEPEAANDNSAAANETKGQVTIASRIGTLLFVRVKGNAKEEGQLLKFYSDKSFYQQSPVNFSLYYENTGRVHLTPYATIEISNIMGKKIDEINVAPWFVMPGFKRNVTVKWDKGLALGRYTATLKLNRGYQDIVDEKTINFWIVPMNIIIIGLAVIIILSILIIWFSSKFELKKK